MQSQITAIVLEASRTNKSGLVETAQRLEKYFDCNAQTYKYSGSLYYYAFVFYIPRVDGDKVTLNLLIYVLRNPSIDGLRL